MLPSFLAVSAIVPSLLLMWYFHSRDVFREPARVLWATFGLGVLVTVLVLVLALPINWALGRFDDPVLAGLAGAFLCAAIPEEFCKFLVLYGFAARRREFDEPMDGVVYGVAASLGFATLENVLYVLGGGGAVAIARAVTAVPCHAFLGAIMGYHVGRAKFGPGGKGGHLFLALLVPILLHGLYDLPILTINAFADTGEAGILGLSGDGVGSLVVATILVLIVECIWALVLTRRLRREQLHLRAEQAAAAVAVGPAPAAGLAPAPFGSPGSAPAPYPVAPAPGQTAYPAPPPPADYRVAPIPPPAPGAYPGAPLPPVVAAAAPPSPPAAARAASAVVGWIFVVVGGLVASSCGLIVLGILAALVGDKVRAEDVGSLILGGAVIGLLPFLLGILLFAAGLRRISRASRAALGVPLGLGQPPPAMAPR